MLKEIHDHIVAELQQNSKTDTVFGVTAVLLNLVVLGINWGVASSAGSDRGTGASDSIFVVLIIATLLINGFAIKGLLAGKGSRHRLVEGLVAMYKDNGVDKYYDPSMLDTYATRYWLFIAALICLAAIAIVVPLLERLM